MLVRDRAVVRAKPPALEVRGSPVAPLYRVVMVSGARASGRRVVASRGDHSGISAVQIGRDIGARLGHGLHRRRQRGRAGIGDPAHADAPADFGANQNHRLAFRRSTALVARRFPAEVDLVELNRPPERTVIGIDQQGPQLVQPGPRRLVRAEAQQPLQILRADAGLARQHLEQRAKPQPQRLARTMQDRPRRHAGLMVAGVALEEAVRQRAHPRAVARRAPRLPTPPHVDQVRSAVLLRAETAVEFGLGAREPLPELVEVSHGKGLYRLYQSQGDTHVQETTKARKHESTKS